MKKTGLVVLFIVIAFILVNNQTIDHYITVLKTETLSVGKQKSLLREEIERKAQEYEIPPVDAKIDRVWKAIPGYNGLKVDVEASYNKMKGTGKFAEKDLVFQQTSPAVHLSDLPAAPIYKGNPEKPMAAFIINVAWGNEYIPDMLATLKKRHVSASFFLEGRWAKQNPELVKMIAAAGHEVGNHSYSHPNMERLGTAKIHEEIKKTNEVIEATTGINPIWFAPPSGSYRDQVVQIAAAMKLGTVMWSVDTIDWQKPAPHVLIQRVVTKVHNGALILMHPTDSTAKALDQLIMQINEKDIELGTVSEALSEKRLLKK
ncbi:hypothetical protein CVD25_21295 [Bacillus canaveralius]|uniref:NodB homology domain-containing protein n=1 Tax=Bacillus canaveralius TaxID=1403243 RepID=A0A2N5GP83_9BACI|nr:polysaccharide deacetylase family protein [Bacillus canaveralius]PLR84259.1 hypothetical protein CU635_08095 [Bacillus canaveralius]PLR89437.1 hypothetical protein CVD25_21295 [Bacillus canaveralius]